MARICLCLHGKTLAQNVEMVKKNQKFVDIAELRVDCLDPEEWFFIRRFPEMVNVPVILSIRRELDGGFYSGGEGARITMLAKGLAFAEADQRRNFAYVDLEEDLDVPSLEEAARIFGTRIIRSWHNIEGVGEDLKNKMMQLRRVGDEIVKVSVRPRSLDDLAKVYKAAKETEEIKKIIYCKGEYGANTRILAEFLGSLFSYTYPELSSTQDAQEQLTPKELVELYRFRKITKKTRVFAVCGYPLKAEESLRFFNAVFDLEQNDAVFVPLPAESIDTLFSLAEEIGISGFSITVPHKKDILPYLIYRCPDVLSIGTCNTIIAGPHGWMGFNTEAAGFSSSLLSFIGRKDLRGRKLTIVGAGGIAHAVAAEVHRLRGKALILNRTVARARDLAELYRFAWAGLDSRGANMIEKYSNIIIQTSPVGMESNEDVLEFYKFSGRETVMDLVYNPMKTRFLARAEKAGCRILNGYDMLRRQVQLQYTHFIGDEFPPSLISRINF